MKLSPFSRTCSRLSRAARLHRLRDVAVVLIMLALCFPVLAQTTWIKHNNNPVLSGGPSSAWDGGRIFYHFILFDGTQYRMWYTGYNPNLSAKPAIGYATSPDGINWMKYANNPILTPNPTGFEEDGLFEPVVIFDGTRYQMWYDGSSQSESVFATGYATSPDGLNWTKHSGNPVLQGGPAGSWDDQGAFPSTVRFDGGTYRMWYNGFDGEVARFGHATSSDGIHWSKYLGNPILDISSAGAWDSFLWLPDVHFDGTTYQMWYSGFGPSSASIGHATSADGLNWTKSPANPIINSGASGTWESGGAGDPRVLFDGNTRKMWYIGADDQINIRIGYANTPLTHDVMVAAVPEHLRQVPMLANVAPKVTLMNAGLSNESNLTVTCQIDSAGVVVYSDRQELASLSSLATGEITFKNWRTHGESQYRASFYATKLGNDENVFNDTLRATINVSSLLDDFETGFGKWASAAGWGLNGQRFRSGKFSMDDSPTGNYGNNANSAVTYNFSFDLSQQRAAHLSYWSWNVLQPNDYGYVEVSTDGGATWNQLGARHEGVQRSFAQEYRSLTPYCGPGFNDVRIRFRLVTDASSVFPGWNVDDIDIHEGESPTAVAEQESEGAPQSYALLGNYPNPFNPETTIEYQLPRAGKVKVVIYNLAGQLVRILIDAQQAAGRFKLNWDGKDERGNQVASGVYLYELQAGNFWAKKKMVLMR